MRLGIVARCDNTGLGNQTRELVNMLNPDKILLINSSFFNGNKQNTNWYRDYNVEETRAGFPKRGEMVNFIRDLDVVLSCETFYSSLFVDIARNAGVKTILQYNYELLVNIKTQHELLPDVFLAPSLWNIDNMRKMFGDRSDVIYLPPPTSIQTFEKAREFNTSKIHNRILHVAGKRALKDRNGTDTVLEMLKYSKEDYDLVVTSQTEIESKPRDARVKIHYPHTNNREDLYYGFDAMVLPRRYAGLCLPMNEALISGMPVFMTDISPNNMILPKDWLVNSEKLGELRIKADFDYYSADPKELAKMIDNFISMKKEKQFQMKQEAFEIGYNNYSPDVLKPKYLDLINSLK